MKLTRNKVNAIITQWKIAMRNMPKCMLYISQGERRAVDMSLLKGIFKAISATAI